jgi:hypothetical protein
VHKFNNRPRAVWVGAAVGASVFFALALLLLALLWLVEMLPTVEDPEHDWLVTAGLACFVVAMAGTGALGGIGQSVSQSVSIIHLQCTHVTLLSFRHYFSNQSIIN